MGKRKTQEKKKKITLVFDENKRKEFLCGFRKRKLERKKKAQEELQRLLKEEKKRIKQENKEAYKKLVVSSRPIPDIEQLLQEEYEDEDVNVKIVELSTDTLQKKDLVIGENRPKVKEESNKTLTKKKENGVHTHEIPGMGSELESEAEDLSPEDPSEDKIKTKKEVKRMLKKQATKKIQKSKVFQMKSKLDRVQNKKKSMKKKGHSNGNMDHKKSKKKVGRKKH
ncbi:nucleolar protein 12 [Plodia interpunctella]|uniref:nucleolar protein 12 n=1 Tax=Plodia interpunctella TaxID=58824 RepID=UPI00236791F9|nr:nucleolar protein 12 [Plodia interpunctella]